MSSITKHRTPIAVLALASSLTAGAVPSLTNDTTKFFRADGTYAVPPGSGGSYLNPFGKNPQTDFGANNVVGDGITDDSAHWAAIVATGSDILIPAGCYILTSTAVNLAQGQVITGASERQCGLIWAGLTLFALNANASYAELHHFSIIQKSGTTPTAGGMIAVGNASTTVSATRISNIYGGLTYDGIYWFGRSNSHRTWQCNIGSCLNGNIHSNCAVPYTCGWIQDTNSSVGLYGFKITASDTSMYTGCGDFGSTFPLTVVTATQPSFVMWYCEGNNSSTVNAIDIGTGVRRLRMTEYELVVLCTNIINVAAGAVDVGFSKMESSGNSIVDSGTNSIFDDFHASTFTAHGPGVRLRNGVITSLVSNSSATAVDIQGCNVTAATLNAASTGIDSTYSGNSGVLSDRLYLTSVTITTTIPYFIGQQAIVLGTPNHIYQATGVSSAADWTQLI